MIKEAIEYIKSLVEGKRQISIHHLNNGRADQHIIVNADGQWSFVTSEPGDRRLTGGSVSELVKMAKLVKSDATRSPIIIYGYAHAQLIFNQYKAGERMVVELGGSREMEFFDAAFRKGQGAMLSVKDAVQIFDTTLRDTMQDPSFLKSIGKLKVIAEKSAEAGHDANSSLVGGIARAAVDENITMPDGVQTFNVMPYHSGEFPQRLSLSCYLRADLEQTCWKILPIEKSIASFRLAAAEMIGDKIKCQLGESSDIPVIQAGTFEQAVAGNLTTAQA